MASFSRPVEQILRDHSRLPYKRIPDFTRSIVSKVARNMMDAQYLDVPVLPADAAFGLLADFSADQNSKKVSLIAGAYRDEKGLPWILPSVKQVSLSCVTISSLHTKPHTTQQLLI
jgi:hypothetical protein